MDIVICVIVAIILMIVGMPIPFSFGIPIGVLYFLTGIKTTLIPSSGFFSISSFTVLSIPFFIYLGDIMAAGGAIAPLINFSRLLIGKLKYSLAQVVVVTNIFFGAITGSGVAAVAATGSLLYPSLVKDGYDRKYSAALVSSAGAIGFLIPPSIPLIVFASVIEGASIGELFAGGIIPGLILSALFMIINHYRCRQTDVAIELQPTEKTGDQEALNTVIRAIPALLMPIIILGGIYGGIFDPTSAAGIACFYSILVGFFIYRKLNWRKLIKVSKSSATSIASILIVMFFLTALSRIFVYMQLPQNLAALVVNSRLNRYLILFLVDLLLIFMGMLMDAVSGTLVAAPLLSPIMVSLGISSTHFGIIMCTAFAMGLITPPVAPNLYVASRVTGVKTTEFLKDLIPFLLAFFIALLLITYIPFISEFLPGLLVK